MKVTRWLLLAALVGCGDRAPTAPPGAEPLLGLPVLYTGLVRCGPLAAASASQVIGPGGGVIDVGPHRLSIPAGALAAPVTITATAPADTVNRVHFEPQGLTFALPASLTMSYANCAGLQLVPKRIAYTSEALTILELLPSIDNLLVHSVTAQLGHFSDYAIAW